MPKTGSAHLPLHGGKAPAWLFAKMVPLSAAISEIIIRDFGVAEYLTRLSDPHWFQSFGCVLGFDWHSSGLTTTVCGALKEGLKIISSEYGVYVCGGKGKTSRKTPSEIETIAPKVGLDANKLVYASKMSAKVDSAAVQDGYQLYHHTFIFAKDGSWSVIQQGMNEENRYARRYHWLDLDNSVDFVKDPHAGIAAEQKTPDTLNMVDNKSGEAQIVSLEVSKASPEKTVKEWKRLQELSMPRHHDIKEIKPENLHKILLSTYANQPKSYEDLIATPGFGPKSVRALALIGELIYGITPSYRDPATYSFAHGGKDGIPYPVDRENYDNSINVLRHAIEKAKIGDTEKFTAMRKLALLSQSYRIQTE